MTRKKATPHRSTDQLDCEARLAVCARALAEPNWTGTTHVIADRDGLFGRNTEVQFNATRKARAGDFAVFLHRTQRKAIECRLVSVDGDGWSVLRLSRKDRGRREQLDREDWCGGFRSTVSLMEKKTYRRRIKAFGGRCRAAPTDLDTAYVVIGK